MVIESKHIEQSINGNDTSNRDETGRTTPYTGVHTPIFMIFLCGVHHDENLYDWSRFKLNVSAKSEVDPAAPRPHGAVYHVLYAHPSC